MTKHAIRDPATGRFVREPEIIPEEPPEISADELRDCFAAATCRKLGPNDWRCFQCETSAGELIPHRSCSMCMRDQTHLCAGCSTRIRDLDRLCAQCNAEAAAETMGDYDTRTIAADPFHDPAPSWVGRVWRRVLQTLGW